MREDIKNWEEDLRKLGYTTEQIIAITMSIIKRHNKVKKLLDNPLTGVITSKQIYEDINPYEP